MDTIDREKRMFYTERESMKQKLRRKMGRQGVFTDRKREGARKWDEVVESGIVLREREIERRGKGLKRKRDVITVLVPQWPQWSGIGSLPITVNTAGPEHTHAHAQHARTHTQTHTRTIPDLTSFSKLKQNRLVQLCLHTIPPHPLFPDGELTGH